MSLRRSPTFMPETPSSKPGIILPAPTWNDIGPPCFFELSNSRPSGKVPTYWTFTELPGRASGPVPSLSVEYCRPLLVLAVSPTFVGGETADVTIGAPFLVLAASWGADSPRACAPSPSSNGTERCNCTPGGVTGTISGGSWQPTTAARPNAIAPTRRFMSDVLSAPASAPFVRKESIGADLPARTQAIMSGR